MSKKYASPPPVRMPPYRKHKASGRAIVQYGPLYGPRPKYLAGEHGSAESWSDYQTCCQEILAHQLGKQRNQTPPKPPANLTTVRNLTAGFLHWAESHYGKANKEFKHLRIVADLLNAKHADTLLKQFGPIALKEVRQEMIRRGWSRGHVNHQVDRVRRFVRWGCENEYCDGSVLFNLKTVAGLRKGKSEARETEPVKPVAWSAVRRVLPYVPRLLRVAIRVQWRSGIRSDELTSMRPQDIDGWVYKPPEHKTAWRGKVKVICFGPRARRLLGFVMPESESAHVFSPAAVMLEHRASRARLRKTKIYGAARSRQPKDRRVRARYDAHSYQRAINFGFEKLAKSLGHKRPKGAKLAPWLASIGIEHWHPHRLRHSRATIIRERYGIEGAQAVLGNTLASTELYAEKSLALALRIARETG